MMAPAMDRPSFQERAARAKAATPLSSLIGASVKLRHVGHAFGGLCPFHHEKTPSFNVNDQLGRYKCFGCGAGGDALDWIAHVERVGPARALEILEARGGLSPVKAIDQGAVEAWRAQREREQAEDQASKVAWARGLWRECRPIKGTLAERYLAARAILIDPGPAVGFHGGLKHPTTGAALHPVMVAAVTDAAGQTFGIHRTFLAASGKAKADLAPAKMMGGVCAGRCVRLGMPSKVTGNVLAIGEGIESCLSVRQVMGLPVWAALSLANMGRVPVPPDGAVREIILLADADEADRAAADEARARAADMYVERGFSVRIATPPEGSDFNDVLRTERQP